MCKIKAYVAAKHKYIMATGDSQAAAHLMDDVSRIYVQMFTGRRAFDSGLENYLAGILVELDELVA